MGRNIHHVLYNHLQSLCPLHFYVYFYRHLLIANHDILQVFITTYQPYQLHQPESEQQFRAKYFLRLFLQIYLYFKPSYLIGCLWVKCIIVMT